MGQVLDGCDAGAGVHAARFIIAGCGRTVLRVRLERAVEQVGCRNSHIGLDHFRCPKFPCVTSIYEVCDFYCRCSNRSVVINMFMLMSFRIFFWLRLRRFSLSLPFGRSIHAVVDSTRLLCTIFHSTHNANALTSDYRLSTGTHTHALMRFTTFSVFMCCRRCRRSTLVTLQSETYVCDAYESKVLISYLPR